MSDLQIFSSQATSGNTDFLGVENRAQGLCNNDATTTIDETVQVKFAYLSNVTIPNTKDYPTQTYNFDCIDMCMADFRTLFFRPVTNHFHMSRQNYSNVAYCIPRQTYCDTSGSKKYSFVDSIQHNWAEVNHTNASALPTIQNIQLIKAGQKFVSLVALKGVVSGLTFDQLIHEWTEFNPTTNSIQAVIECYIQYDPLQVSVRCFFNYKVTIPGASYGNDSSVCPANLIAAYLNNGMKISNNGCACNAPSTDQQPKGVTFSPSALHKDDESVLTEKTADDFFFGNENSSKVYAEINQVNNDIGKDNW
tara:strand:+ start:55 stop:975 length:921 start_codon:yes stop_codon:yes gene_type:complete